MVEFGLLVFALVLFAIFGTIGFVFQLVDNLFHINKYLFKVAICIDQLGNVVCSGLFNHLLRRPGGYEFGSEDETISSVIGKNKKTNTLTFLGKWVAKMLNKIEANHVENAIDK